MDKLKEKALSYGATDLKKSNRKDKKYYVVYNDKKIHFGHTKYQDFTQHNDPERRKRYLARATKIKDSSGKLTAENKNSANFWAINLLW